MLLGSASSLQRFGVMYIKALGVSQLSGLGQTMLQLSDLKQTMLQLLDKSVLQLCVTALFYLENRRRIHPPDKGMPTQRREPAGGRKRQTKRERESPLAPLFICFFLPLGLPYVNWARQECCLFYLRSSLRSLDLPLTLLCSIFMGFPLPCLLATAILDSCFLF